MASVSTTMPAATFARPNPLRICFKEAKYEFLKCLRLPMYSVSTMLFPIMFYVLFGLVMGRQTIGSISTSVYLIPAYGTFGVMGASLFGTAATLAGDRGLGWLQVKRASPMPIYAYFLAKVVMSVIFSTVDVLALLTLGVAFGGVHIPTLVAAKLVLTLVSGSLPFCTMGLAIGYFAGPTSAPAVINIFYLPMSFCSGLWMPFMFLPKFVQKIAVFLPLLPPYHLSQLVFHQVGAGQGGQILWHWESLLGFSLVCLGIAWVGHQRDQKANG
ncbi:MAG: ABC transporter permease [Acidobacteria bacterium]|nr:MAG: ABC transporter permease [Acidobacteriota bacterium]